MRRGWIRIGGSYMFGSSSVFVRKHYAGSRDNAGQQRHFGRYEILDLTTPAALIREPIRFDTLVEAMVFVEQGFRR
jgi:hypothetical protein